MYPNSILYQPVGIGGHPCKLRISPMKKKNCPRPTAKGCFGIRLVQPEYWPAHLLRWQGWLHSFGCLGLAGPGQFAIQVQTDRCRIATNQSLRARVSPAGVR